MNSFLAQRLARARIARTGRNINSLAWNRLISSSTSSFFVQCGKKNWCGRMSSRSVEQQRRHFSDTQDEELLKSRIDELFGPDGEAAIYLLAHWHCEGEPPDHTGMQFEYFMQDGVRQTAVWTSREKAYEAVESAPSGVLDLSMQKIIALSASQFFGDDNAPDLFRVDCMPECGWLVSLLQLRRHMLKHKFRIRGKVEPLYRMPD